MVTETPLQGIASLGGPKDILIQTRSLADALTQLSASTTTRKGLLITTPAAGNVSIPDGIEVRMIEASNLSREVVQLRCEYVLLVEGASSSTALEVVLKQQPGLPTLRAHWKPIATR